MKLKVKTIILFGLISAAVRTDAQQLFYSDPSLKSIFGNRRNISSYSIGNNPAYLGFDKGDQLLSLQSLYSNSNGQFRRFVDPSVTEFYQVSASGKKSIDSFQVFKGSFGFQRLDRKNWNWLVSRDYDNFNPFLLGDSTTGKTHYNGIIMNAQYSAVVFQKLLLGFMLNYGVDEGLKESFPRPTTDHRDIDFIMGLGYLLSNEFSVGASVKLFDYNEKITYQEDQLEVSREVFLLKFKGLDFPFVNKKKTETRYTYKNGFFSYGNVSYLTDDFDIAACFGGGLEQLTLKEDGVNPVTQGYWKNQIYEGALRSSFRLYEKLFWGLNYSFKHDNMWAKHPSAPILMMESSLPNHSVNSGLEYPISEKFTLGLEGGLEIRKFEFDDYYSHIFCDLEGSTASLSAGCDVTWNSKLKTFLSYGISKFSVKNSNLTQGSQSAYFSDYRVKDILFFMTDYLKHSVDTKISIEPAKWGIINVYLSYKIAIASENTQFKNSKRSNFNSSLELKIKAY